MSPPPSSGPRTFPRRTVLVASAAGVTALAGCTSSSARGRDAVTSLQADELADQVAVQGTLVAAYDLALGADPALAAAVADLATQAGEQLERLRAASPGSSGSGGPPASTPPAGTAQEWLRAQVAAAATSHAAACLDQSGARAALLGSIAAGLRGHEARLA